METKQKPVTPKDDNFKEIVFRRVLAKCNFEVGQYVKIRGTNHRGQIKSIFSDLEDVSWVKDRPFFIVVEFSDGSTRLANPSQIHRRRVK